MSNVNITVYNGKSTAEAAQRAELASKKAENFQFFNLNNELPAPVGTVLPNLRPNDQPVQEGDFMQVKKGTYTNVDSEPLPVVKDLGKLYFDGDKWIVSLEWDLVKGENGNQLSPDWTGGLEDVGLEYPKVRVDGDILYRVIPGQTAGATDRPSLTASKWKPIGKVDVSGKIESDNTEAVTGGEVYANAVNAELDKQGGEPVVEELGVTVNGIAGGDNVMSYARWNTNAVATENGEITEIKFYSTVAGRIGLCVLNLDRTLDKIIDDNITAVVGLNTYIPTEPVSILKGQVPAIAGLAVSSLATISYSTGADPNSIGIERIVTRANGTEFSRSDGFFAYSYTLNYVTSRSRLYDTFVELGNMGGALDEYLNNTSVDPIDIKYGVDGVAPTSSNTFQNKYMTSMQPVEADCIVKSIDVYVGQVGNIVVSIGLVDQNDIWIVDREIIRSLPASGWNTIELQEELKQGQQLAVKGTVANASLGRIVGSGYYRTHVDNTNNLSVVAGFDLLFSYTVNNIITKAIAKQSDVAVLDNRVGVLETKDAAVITSKPTGYKFKLVCDDDGSNLRAEPLYPNNIVILGNSITRHGLTSYWWGDWGMAATERQFDFVHRFQSMVQEYNPSSVVSGNNIAPWETGMETYNKALLNPMIAGAGLIIIRLGENVPTNKISILKAQMDLLIQHIKTQNPAAEIVVTGNFWTNMDKESAIRSSASTNRCKFIQLYQFDNAENKSFIGDIVMGDDGLEHEVASSGVANHPNNVGMENIAITLFNSIF